MMIQKKFFISLLCLIFLLCLLLIISGCSNTDVFEYDNTTAISSTSNGFTESIPVSINALDENWKKYGFDDSQAYIPSLVHTSENGTILEYRNLKFGSLSCSFSNARFVDNIHDLPTIGKQYFRGGQSIYMLSEGTETRVDVVDQHFTDQNGSFFDGVYLLLVDVRVTSNNATDWTSYETHTQSDGTQVPAGEFTDPYLFRVDSIVSLSDTSIETTNYEGSSGPDSYYTRSINYYSRMGENPENPILFRLEPGDEITFTIGFLVGDNRKGGPNDLTCLVLSDYSGGFEGNFIDLQLEAP